MFGRPVLVQMVLVCGEADRRPVLATIGYGPGALLSMLQTCAPGMSVVNIDNGVCAGMTAALIANRVAHAHEHQSQ